MFFNWTGINSLLILLLLNLTNVQAASIEGANNTRLTITPERCVALRKGQVCYSEVTFKWQHPLKGDYCLVNITTNSVIKCWVQVSAGKFHLDFQSTQTNDFALLNKKSEEITANAHITVAWVYKSSKRAKSTWRLF